MTYAKEPAPAVRSLRHTLPDGIYERVTKSEAQECGILGESGVIRDMISHVQTVAPTMVSVLLTGETGTGKESCARYIHRCSGRAGAFVAVNCGALSAGLIEAELFGHDKGAFTGADRRRAGAFERADGGTLFLDEIGEMPIDQQPRLLRALQEGEVQPIGSGAVRRVRVRAIAATNRDLASTIADGRFRADLYHRLRGYRIVLPPLRARDRDAVVIIRHLLAEEFPGLVLSTTAERLLATHPWPDNIRELQNVVRAAAIDCEGWATIDDVHLTRHLEEQTPRHGQGRDSRGIPLQDALADTFGRRGRATQWELRTELGISARRVQQLLRELVRRREIARCGRGKTTYYVSPQALGLSLRG